MPRPAGPPVLPVELASSGHAWARQGSARFRWAVFEIYEISLYVDLAQPDPGRPSALVFEYLRHVDAATLVDSTVREIERISRPPPAMATRWRTALETFVPNLSRGDRLTAVCDPIRGTTFHLRGKPLGSIAEPEFAAAFLAIWLDPATSAVTVRSGLLGPSPA